jgi:hypothetical protein
VGCGTPFFATLYFFSFTVLVGMVFLRLFIAIILSTFHQTTEKDSKFMSSDLSENFRDCWSLYDPDATSFIKVKNYKRFLLDLGEPLGWDPTFNHNFIKQHEYLAEISLPKYNTEREYQFMDVFEHLVLIMIIRREVINFGIRSKHFELLGNTQEEGQEQENFEAPYESPRPTPHAANAMPSSEAMTAAETRKRNHYMTSNMDGKVKRNEIVGNQKIDSNRDMLIQDYQQLHSKIPKKAKKDAVTEFREK